MLSNHKYVLLQRIGFGSYSEVYKAKQSATQKIVAVKIMKESYNSKWKSKQKSQINLLRKFANNPCIINQLECFLHKDKLYIVFEFLDITLIDYYKMIKQKYHQGLSKKEIRLVMYQVLIALEQMHREDITHRDIKPENILINLKNFQVKLVDFGLAKKLDKFDNTNYIATRWYRSPEILLGMKYDNSVDTFALGCVFIEMYLGVQVFQGKDSIDQLNQIFKFMGSPSYKQWPEGYQKLKQLNISLPMYLKTDLRKKIPGLTNQACNLIQRLLEYNPSKRSKIKILLKHPYFHEVQSQLSQRVKLYIRNLQNQKQIQKEPTTNTTINYSTSQNIQMNLFESKFFQNKKNKLNLTSSSSSEWKKSKSITELKWCCKQEQFCQQQNEEYEIVLLMKKHKKASQSYFRLDNEKQTMNK